MREHRVAHPVRRTAAGQRRDRVPGEEPDPVGQQGWDVYVTGTPPLDVLLQDTYMKFLAFDVDDPTFDWHTFNFDVDPLRMATMHAILDPVQDDLTAFGDGGGKMIIYQGWGDISESPYRTLQYYAGLRRHKGRRAVEDYARLFMAPGVGHCEIERADVPTLPWFT